MVHIEQGGVNARRRGCKLQRGKNLFRGTIKGEKLLEQSRCESSSHQKGERGKSVLTYLKHGKGKNPHLHAQGGDNRRSTVRVHRELGEKRRMLIVFGVFERRRG